MNTQLHIEGMSCQHCAGKVKVALEEIAEVVRADVILDSQTVQVEMTAEVEPTRFSEAVEAAGYTFAGVR